MIRKIALVAVCFALGSVAVLAADFSGKWTAQIETPMGVQNTTFDFHVDGAKLTGTVTSDQGANEIKEGKIDGDNISFVQEMNGPMGSLQIVYNGKIDGDQIKLSRKFGDFGTDKFVAKRAQ